MKKIETVILDDDENSCTAALQALSAYEELHTAGVFHAGDDLFDWLEENRTDLIFLDIELNGEMGFQIAQRLKKEYPSVLIVFLTGHSSYAIDGYDFGPVNFLTKPINERKLSQTIEQVKERLGESVSQESAKLMFHTAGGYQLIDVRDIICLERMDRKIVLHLSDGKDVSVQGSMKELDGMLSSHGFYQCHQSFIVSLYRIQSVASVGRQVYELKLSGYDQAVPLARGKYNGLLKELRALNLNL